MSQQSREQKQEDLCLQILQNAYAFSKIYKLLDQTHGKPPTAIVVGHADFTRIEEEVVRGV